MKILNSIEAKSKRKREEGQAPRKFHETEKGIFSFVVLIFFSGKKQAEKLPSKGNQTKEKEKEKEKEIQIEKTLPMDSNLFC